MGDYSEFHGCSVGSSAFQLKEYGLKVDPVLKGGARVGTKFTITGEGWIDGQSQSEVSEKIAAVIESFSFSGQNIIITGLGGEPELEILGSGCLSGGPHITYEMRQSVLPLTRDFTFSVLAEQPDISGGPGKEKDKDGNPVTPIDTYESSLSTRPDGLRIETRTGELLGAGANAAFLGRILPGFQRLHRPNRWIVNYQFKQNFDVSDSKLSYTMTAEEQLDVLPSAGPQAFAVTGTAAIRKDRDEQMRLVTIQEYDLLIVGDAIQLLTFLRPKNKVILLESLSITGIRERKLQLSFRTLEGGNGNNLVDWTQTLSMTSQPGETYDVQEYFGSDPVFVLKKKSWIHFTQTGRAVGIGLYPVPPDPIFSRLISPKQIHFTPRNAVEKETSWTYEMFSESLDDGTKSLGKLERPGTPTFYTGNGFVIQRLPDGGGIGSIGDGAPPPEPIPPTLIPN